MAIRTTDELVGGIIKVNAAIPLEPFIAAASSLVDMVDETVNEDEEVLTGARLTLIETWLAAHFYSIRDPRRTSEKAGSVAATYVNKVDLGLNLTWHGQQAMLLDTTGTLRAMSRSSGRRQKVTWLGKECEA